MFLLILSYGLDHIPQKKLILDHWTLSSIKTKLLMTNNMDTLRQCQQSFNLELSNVSDTNKIAKFQSLFHVNSSNLLHY